MDSKFAAKLKSVEFVFFKAGILPSGEANCDTEVKIISFRISFINKNNNNNDSVETLGIKSTRILTLDF